jgi:hypothetical protein
MQIDEQTLIVLFEQVARKDPDMMDSIARTRYFQVEPDRWLFTLPRLFEFLQYQDLRFTNIDYKGFRQLIFNCPINLSIKPYRAEIIIIDNQDKVDRSTYAMIWHHD